MNDNILDLTQDEDEWHKHLYTPGAYKRSKGKVKLTAKKQYRKVVAKQGNSRYLIDVGNDKGVIVDTNTGETFKPFNIHSILARGYWNEYEGEDDSKILGML